MNVSWLGLGPVPEEIPPAGYAYKCEDLGYMKPWLYRFFVTPLSLVTPRSIAANDISLVAFLCSLAPIIVFMVFDTAPDWVRALVPGLGLFLYIILDHLDGTHARRTGTSSPLGEYLDHWLDGWNGGLVNLGVALAWGATAPVAATLTMFGALGYSLAISEQKQTGVLKLDRMSGNEGMLLIWASNILLGALGRDRAIALQLYGGYTLAHLFQFLCWWGMVGTCKNVFMREGIRRTLPDCMPIVVNGLLAVAWAASGLDGRVASWLIATSGAICAGRLILARTAGLAMKWDGVSTAAIALGYGYCAWARPDAHETSVIGLVSLGVVLVRAFGDFAWALEAFARFVRKGELLALFIAPRAPEADTAAPAVEPIPPRNPSDGS